MGKRISPRQPGELATRDSQVSAALLGGRLPYLLPFVRHKQRLSPKRNWIFRVYAFIVELYGSNAESHNVRTP